MNWVSNMAHIPVLLNEVMAFCDPKPGEFVIDGTAGGGGYSRATLERLGGRGTLLALDWDVDMARRLRTELKVFEREGSRVAVVQANFADIPEILRREQLPHANVLLLDLGFSSDQLEESGRGFSFERDEPLLMTYSDESEPVREILRRLNEGEIAEIIKEFGEERYARRIAYAIKLREKEAPIMTSGELARTVAAAVPKGYERGRIHSATRTFLAFRIYANHEFENLSTVLQELRTILVSGGRAAIVSFHSGEDRIVKEKFRGGVREGYLKLLVKKPIVASAEEIVANPRARSAKLRVAQVL